MDLDFSTEIIMTCPKAAETSGIGLVSGTYIEFGISFTHKNAIRVQWSTSYALL